MVNIITYLTGLFYAPHLVGDYKYSAQNINHGKWLLCQGQAISRTTYLSLFTIIGTSFGAGDGSTTFNLPDFRGKVAGTIGRGVGLTNRTLGQFVGEESHLLTAAESGRPAITTQRGSTGNVAATAIGGTNLATNTTVLAGANASVAHNVMQPTLFGGNIFIFSGV